VCDSWKTIIPRENSLGTENVIISFDTQPDASYNWLQAKNSPFLAKRAD
jgi:hypothetical protein